MVQQEIRLTEEEDRQSRAVGMGATVHGHDGKQRSETRHHATCPILMPDCTNTGPPQMETRYCPQGAGIHIRTGKKEEKKETPRKRHAQQSTLLRKVRQARKQRPQLHKSLMNLIAVR